MITTRFFLFPPSSSSSSFARAANATDAHRSPTDASASRRERVVVASSPRARTGVARVIVVVGRPRVTVTVARVIVVRIASVIAV